MIPRWSRRTLAIRIVVAILGAFAMVLFTMTPGGAAPDNSGGVTAPAPPSNGTTPPGDGTPAAPPAGTTPPATGGNSQGADQVVGEPGDVCREENGKTVCTGESDVAKQCNQDKEVAEMFMESWVGLAPGVIGCAAITALDRTLTSLGLALDVTKVYLTNDATDRPQDGWFAKEYGFVREVAIWTIPPIFLIALMHAFLAGKYDRLLQIALVYLPLSLIGSVVAIEITQQLLNITDDISNVFQRSIEGDANVFMVMIAKGFGPEGFVVSNNGDSWVITVFLGLGLLMTAAVMWIILSLREASIYIAALFFPIVFAMLIWPSLHKYFKKLVEFIIGMIISKVVMVAAISLMVASITSATGYDSVAAMGLALNGEEASQQEEKQGMWAWYAQTVTMIFTFFIVCFAPNIPSKLFANVGFEDTGRHQSAMQNRPDMKRKIDWGNRMVGVATGLVGLHNAISQWGPAREAGQDMDPYSRRSRALGLSSQPAAYTAEQRARRGFGQHRGGNNGNPPPKNSKEWHNNFSDHIIERWSGSEQFDERYFADVLMSIGGEALERPYINQGTDPNGNPGDPTAAPRGYQWAVWQRTDVEGNVVRKVELVMNGHDRNNNQIDISPRAVDAAIRDVLKTLGDDVVAEIAVHAPLMTHTGGSTLTGGRGPGGAPAVYSDNDPRAKDIATATAIKGVIAEHQKHTATRIKFIDDAVAKHTSDFSHALDGDEAFPVGRK